MAKAKKLPSGNWNVKLFVGKDNGKRVYKSFTAHTKAEAELKAAQYKAGIKENDNPLNITLGEAIDRYISIKDNVLSPSTIKGYKVIRKTCLKNIENTKLADLTQEVIQIEINELAAGHTPKTVRNVHGLISAVLKMYRPSFKLSTTLPQREDKEIEIPTEDEVIRILESAKGTVMEIPMYLAACCGLRRSEIIGLKWSCVNFDKGTIRIQEARVKNDKNELVEKGTKETASYRTIKVYPFIMEALKREYEHRTGEYVTPLTGDAIYDRYKDILDKLNIQPYRLHDLRHYVASAMLALNIPKNYIAAYLGHASENMIERVYGHIMKEKQTTVDEQLEKYFTGLMQHKIQHENEDV